MRSSRLAGTERRGPPAGLNYAADAYRAAGVDREAAERLKGSLGRIAASSSNPRVLDGIGGFGGQFRLDGYKRPVIVSSTDGIGTKLLLGRWTGRFHSLGIDLVNACLNDVIVTGADPLFFLDYLAAGTIRPEVIEALVGGMADACAEAGCVLIGGETAEMPGVYGEGEFDMAGFAVGAAEEDSLLNPSRVDVGDLLVGIPSSGIHTNGFSLVRRVFGLDSDPAVLDGTPTELGRSLGEELSEPHRSYVREVASIRDRVKVLAHITGGGLVENVPRVLPDGVGAQFDLGSWDTPPIFSLIRNRGELSDGEMYRVFNMGLGMIAVCDPAMTSSVMSAVPGAQVVGATLKVPQGSAATDRVFFA